MCIHFLQITVGTIDCNLNSLLRSIHKNNNNNGKSNHL